ncbi:MAG: FlgD immunoglobulin-like domain containing protein [Fidelibacterota bacterium]
MKTNTIFGALWLSGVLFTNILFSQETVTYEDFPKGKMMLVGIPLNFDNADPGAVLEPEFGEQFRSGETTPYWRFSRWSVADQTYLRYGEAEHTWDHEAQAYTTATEQGSPPDIAPGVGYWLAQGTANTVTDFSLTGNPVDQESPVYVTLNPPDSIEGHSYPGLNMLANPFLYAIDWKNTQVRINGNTEVSLEQAVNMGLVSQYSHIWDGDQYTPYNMTDGGVLDVWDGFWAEQMNPEETRYVVYDVACEIEGNSVGEDCGSCPDDEYGMLRYLQLRYDGAQSAYISIYDNRWNNLYWGLVEPGEIFEFYGRQRRQGLGSKIYVYVYYAGKCVYPDSYVEIHTSCSVTLGVGQVWGLFTIMAGENKDGIPLCPLEGASRPIVKFYNPTINGTAAELGSEEAIETDRLLISLTDDDNDELAFKTYTVAGDSSDWIPLTQTGVAVSDGQGFTVTLVTENGDDYTLDVASTGSQGSGLAAIKFRFGDQQTIDSPSAGETYTATRLLFGGTQVTLLELKIPPVEAEPELKKSTQPPAHPLVAETAGEWIVPIGVSNSDESLTDTYNGFGIKANASSMYDPMDARNYTPNLPEGYVDLFFPHHEAGNPLRYWPQNPMKAAYDVCPAAEVITWDLNLVYVYLANQKFTLHWDASRFPSDKELILVDLENSERIDMLAVTEYEITTPQDPYGTLYFVIVAAAPEGAVGVETGAAGPAQFRLLANYPNPFNATTRLSYELSVASPVELNIYNLSGTLVNTLVREYQPAGRYEINWNGCDLSGNPVSTGVYLYQLHAGSRTATRKMVLMK